MTYDDEYSGALHSHTINHIHNHISKYICWYKHMCDYYDLWCQIPQIYVESHLCSFLILTRALLIISNIIGYCFNVICSAIIISIYSYCKLNAICKYALNHWPKPVKCINPQTAGNTCGWTQHSGYWCTGPLVTTVLIRYSLYCTRFFFPKYCIYIQQHWKMKLQSKNMAQLFKG